MVKRPTYQPFIYNSAFGGNKGHNMTNTKIYLGSDTKINFLFLNNFFHSLTSLGTGRCNLRSVSVILNGESKVST